MSEIAPPDLPASAAVSGPSALSQILDDFRRWYEETLETNGELPPVAPPALDLATLLGHFVALRQEINLQTRSVRTQQEQTAEFVRTVSESLEDLSRPEPAPVPAVKDEDNPRPLLKSLVDVYDAIATAGRQIEKARSTLLPNLTEAVPEELPEQVEEVQPLTDEEVEEESSLPPIAAPPSFWERWFGPLPLAEPKPEPVVDPEAERKRQERRARAEQRRQRHREQVARALDRQERARQRQERLTQARQAAERIAQALDGLVTGYTMSLERIDRALRQHGLEPLVTVGETFDPETMEAMEPVAGTGRPSNEVIEEIKRGYLLNGRVFRYAQVRVARG